MNKQLKDKISKLPQKPGTYQMLNDKNIIIYVGKAKNLKNRVSSYFVGVHDEKTTRLVKDIVDFTYIVTQSEKEAFLLELSKIKKHLPKYNIQLTSDRTYPYIEITNELYPRLKISRDRTSKNYRFGPFPNSTSATETMKLLGTIFPFRKCNKLPKKVCLYYHINQCLGPCEYPVEQSEYTKMRKAVKSFLSGNTKEVLSDLQNKMMESSNKLDYEKAKEYRDLIAAVNKTTEQQQVIFNDNKNRDIINFVTYDNYISINILFMRNGRLLFSKSKIFTYYDNVTSTLLTYLAKFYEDQPKPDEIFLPYGYNYELFEDILGEIIVTPQRGKKAKLLLTAYENAKIHLDNNLASYLNKEKKTIVALSELEELLNIPRIKRIDIFDNSNISGTNLVSAMVVFRNGLPDKNEYRKYKITTVKNADDYSMMKEVIYRRYQLVLVEDLEKPDLVIVDGGIIQVHAAKEIFKELNFHIPVIGLKKDDKHKTSSIINMDDTEIPLDKRSNVYSLLYRMQEEVHRFAISFQRNVHNKSIYASILDTIPLIGKKSKDKLLKKYRTLENIRNASREELKALKIAEKAIDNLFLALKDLNTNK